MKKFKIIEHSKSAIIYTNVEAKTKEQAQEIVMNNDIICDDRQYHDTYFEIKEV